MSKNKSFTTEPRRDEAATKKQDLCTTEALRHGEKAKNKWALSEPLIPGYIQNQGLDI
jgi:hypothetical protein